MTLETPYTAFVCVLVTASALVLEKPAANSTYKRIESAAREVTRTLEDVKSIMFPRHCHDLLRAGQTTSGVYNLFHEAAGPSGQKAYCDMDTHGGGWTVVQRRGQFGNSVLYFKRNWEEYARGFGEPSKEYWIGNRALHALTSAGESMSLRVVLSNTTQDSATVDYASVRVESEDQQFKIHIGKFLGPKGWDSLSYCNGMMFSTFDKDNDWDSEIECAVKFRGGWWYRSCYEANLNGLNLNGHYEDSISGIEWATRGGWMQLFNYSYPGVLMAVRPSDIVNEY